MTTPPPDLSPVRCQADLEHLWHTLMGPLGFSRSTLWFLLLNAAGTPRPMIVPIDDIPAQPIQAVESLTSLLQPLVEPGGSVVFLLTRSGADGPMTDSERAWTRALEQVQHHVSSVTWPVHRANDEALRVCSADDLAA